MNELEKKQRRNIIALRLKEIRTQRGMNQHQVAQAMHCTQSVISKVEAGTAEVSLLTIIEFADVFGCSIDYLLGRDTAHDLNTNKGKMMHSFERMSADNQAVFALFAVTIVKHQK